MGGLDYMQALYEYNEWANNHILEAASGLSEEELGRQTGASYGSVRGNLVHTVGAQIVWLKRWTGEKSEALSLVTGQPDADAIRRAYEISHQGLREYVRSLSEQDLERVVSYVDSRGVARERPLWQLLAHVVNHGTQHRAETAMALTAMGRSPGDLDYVYFEYGRG